MRATFGVGLLFVVGCHHSGLPATGGVAPTLDLAMVSQSVDAGTVDFASPPFDLASHCHYAAPNATTALAGRDLPYAWVGNGDGGGEPGCGGPPEICFIELGDGDTWNYSSKMRTWIAAKLPITLGPQKVSVYTVIGGERMADGTLDVTSFTHTADGVGIDSMQGSIESPSLALSGSFAAEHCRDLDVTCI